MSSLENYKHLSPEAFAELDFKTVTLLDLREQDEVLVSGIEGALNLPFSGGVPDVDGYYGYSQGGTFRRRGAGRSFYVSRIRRTVGYEPLYLKKTGGKASWQRKRKYRKGFIRFSVGLEEPEDITRDLDQALRRIGL